MASSAQAAQRYVADEVIVKYKSGITETQRSLLLERLGVERTPAQVRSKLDAAVDDKGAAGRDSSFGFGRVNLQKAAQ